MDFEKAFRLIPVPDPGDGMMIYKNKVIYIRKDWACIMAANIQLEMLRIDTNKKIDDWYDKEEFKKHMALYRQTGCILWSDDSRSKIKWEPIKEIGPMSDEIRGYFDNLNYISANLNTLLTIPNEKREQ